jgi:hypothetical protein
MATDWSNPSSSFDAMWAAMGFGPQVGAPQGYVSPYAGGNALMSSPIANPAMRTGGVDPAVGGGMHGDPYLGNGMHGDPGGLGGWGVAPPVDGRGGMPLASGPETHDQRMAAWLAQLASRGGVLSGPMAGGSNPGGSAPVDVGNPAARGDVPVFQRNGASDSGAGGIDGILQMLMAYLSGKGGGGPVSDAGGGGPVTMPLPMPVEQPGAMGMNPGMDLQQMALARMFAS